MFSDLKIADEPASNSGTTHRAPDIRPLSSGGVRLERESKCCFKAWQIKLTEICIHLTWHSPPPTPLLPALTLSAGEYRVSGGELKVSRARRPKPKMASLYFWWPSQDSCRVAMVEPPVSYSYSESTVPAAACEVAISVRSASRATRRVRSLRIRSASCAISSGLPPLWEENRLLETS